MSTSTCFSLCTFKKKRERESVGVWIKSEDSGAVRTFLTVICLTNTNIGGVPGKPPLGVGHGEEPGREDPALETPWDPCGKAGGVRGEGSLGIPA